MPSDPTKDHTVRTSARTSSAGIGNNNQTARAKALAFEATISNDNQTAHTNVLTFIAGIGNDNQPAGTSTPMDTAKIGTDNQTARGSALLQIPPRSAKTPTAGIGNTEDSEPNPRTYSTRRPPHHGNMLETADKPGPGRLTTPATTKNDNMGPPPISDDPTTREDHRLALCSDTMPATLVNPRRHDVEWANSISCSVLLYSYSFTGFDPHSIISLTLIDPHEPLSALAALVHLTHLTIAFSTACSNTPQECRLS
mmetsp:Transcript_41561/g.81200  ORF Transcript_41561/g.81200 Transcript_41561/m.81200 type:complete len:254 (-) Transcript_41561:50-811(-)